MNKLARIARFLLCVLLICMLTHISYAFFDILSSSGFAAIPNIDFLCYIGPQYLLPFLIFLIFYLALLLLSDSIPERILHFVTLLFALPGAYLGVAEITKNISFLDNPYLDFGDFLHMAGIRITEVGGYIPLILFSVWILFFLVKSIFEKNIGNLLLQIYNLILISVIALHTQIVFSLSDGDAGAFLMIYYYAPLLVTPSLAYCIIHQFQRVK